MLGDTIARRPIEFDMDAVAADVIQDDEVHGFLAAGLDAGIERAALLRVVAQVDVAGLQELQRGSVFPQSLA